MKKILVTGALGFIGSHFIKYSLEKNDELRVVGFDMNGSQKALRRLDGYRENERLELVFGDMCGDISDILEGVDIVVHFAAKTFVDHSTRATASHVQNNIFGTYKLLEEIRKIRGYKGQNTLLVHVSTDEVYGQIQEGFFDEQSPLNPTNVYSATKAAADMLVIGWTNYFGIPTIITRTENNYGKYQHPQKVIPAFVRKAMDDEALPVYGDGKHKRMWLHVEDHCSAIWFLIDRGASGIYHIAGQEEMENLDLANKILKIMDKPEGRLTFIPDKNIRPVHDRRYALASTKLEKMGWRPKWNVDKGIEEVVKWYVENKWWLY